MNLAQVITLYVCFYILWLQNFTTTQLSEQMARPDDRIIGGTFMEPRDALRIGK